MIAMGMLASQDASFLKKGLGLLSYLLLWMYCIATLSQGSPPVW